MNYIILTQLGLLVLMAILFLTGYYVEAIEVGTFFFCMIIGALGASVSLMQKVRHKDGWLDTKKITLPPLSIMAPIMYGTVLTGVAYLLFMSGLLSGDGGGGLFTTNLFPNFKSTLHPDAELLVQFVEIEPDGIQNTGKLLVWCFIAGYSQKFITGILGQLESKGQTS